MDARNMYRIEMNTERSMCTSLASFTIDYTRLYGLQNKKFEVFHVFFNTTPFKGKLLSFYVTWSPNNILRIVQNTKLLNIVPSLNFWHSHPLRSTFSPQHRLLKSTAHVILLFPLAWGTKFRNYQKQHKNLRLIFTLIFAVFNCRRKDKIFWPKYVKPSLNLMWSSFVPECNF